MADSKTEMLPSPPLAGQAPAPLARVSEDIGGNGKLSHNLINDLIRKAGGETKHVAGALPQILFQNPGDCYILEFLGRNEPDAQSEADGRDFALLDFHVLDPKSYIVESRSVEDCRLWKGCVAETWSYEKWFSPADAAKRVGKVFKVTYTGQAKKKSENRNAATLYAIEEMKLPQRAKVDKASK